MSSTFDKNLELQASTAVAASADATLISFPIRKVGNKCKVIVNVTAVSGTNPTAVLYVNVSPTVGGTKTKIATLPAITAVGQYEIPLSGKLAEQLVPTAAAVGVGVTIGGTDTPTFTFSAFLAPE
jgi:hypothetical protein